ncbi:MAG: alpha/beta hydrolase [Clostridia bacterium]|nr:alpha/beta hydrolase [Clostridia bacterium]
MKLLSSFFGPKKIGTGKYFLIGSGITLAAAGTLAAYAALTRFLMNVAFSREAPKTITKVRHTIEHSEANRDLMNDLAAAAKRLEENCREEYRITTEDGTELVAHYRPCPEPKRLLIAMHGWRSSWSNDFGLVADDWYRSGCNVLFCEQRGQNNSGGENMGFGILERLDCRDWARFASENLAGGLPVYLVGISMGATTVLMAAGLDLPSDVHGIIADCGFTSTDGIWRHVMEDNLHLPYGAPIYEYLAKQRIGVDPKDFSTVESLKGNNIPVFFAHGTDDSFVPVSMTYENYKACTAPKRLFIVPGAEHGLSYRVDPDGYRKAVEEFFRDFDGVVPEPRAGKSGDGSSAAPEEVSASGGKDSAEGNPDLTAAESEKTENDTADSDAQKKNPPDSTAGNAD